ncbi:MAG: branched-chain amino acid transport system permease protein [Frankiaceae bacterium]|jgi:branched-chain amino acid transport system permease protein|nr:branched-chain amino acid transport system permease protein [Frankiaceae bacterium]
MHVVADTFSPQLHLVTPLISGLADGAAFGLFGLGLVLLYKSNRIFNFAQGEFGTVAAIVAFIFDRGVGWAPKLPYFVAILIGVLAAVLVAMATERLVIRPLFNRPRVVLVVATVGVALLLVGVEGLLPYPQTAALRTISDALGVRSYLTQVDGVVVLDQDVAKLIVLAVLAVLSFLFFRYTNTGTAILAVSQDVTAARVVGISVERVSMLTWAIAGFLGGVAGVLLAVPPAGSVTPGAFTGLTLVVAFSAAVLGGMTSLPGAFVGGILIGLINSFANADHSFVPGLNSLPTAQAEVAVALVLLLVLLIRPRGLLGQEA